MEDEDLIALALGKDWSASYKATEHFKKLPTKEKTRLVDPLIERLSTNEESDLLPIIQFFRGHLWISEIPELSTLKLARKLKELASRETVSVEVLEAIAGVFHLHIPSSSRVLVADLLLNLAEHQDEHVRTTAIRNLGGVKSSRDPEKLNDKLLQKLISVWRDENESIGMRSAALHSLHWFGLDLKDEKIRYLISEIVVEALRSDIDEYRHGALWILGGLFFGFKVHHTFYKKVLELLLTALRENRDIPNSWFITAFKRTPGEIPDWAKARLLELEVEEKRVNERGRRLHEEENNIVEPKFKYQVALSFAGEDRRHAEALAKALKTRGISIFYDTYEKADLWGKDLFQHLQAVYKDSARFCVVFLSQAYARKLWTRHELKQAQARAFTQNEEYILPIKLDDTVIPGISDTTGYIEWTSGSAEEIANLLQSKLAQQKSDYKERPPLAKRSSMLERLGDLIIRLIKGIP